MSKREQMAASCKGLVLKKGYETDSKGELYTVRAFDQYGERRGGANMRNGVVTGIALNPGTPRRCGIGTMLWEALAAEACRKGIKMRSDTHRWEASEGFWKKQEQKGRARCIKQSDGSTDRCRQYELVDPCPESLAGLRELAGSPWLVPGLALAGAALLLWARRGQIGVVFANPLPGYEIAGGWGLPRDYRNGTHYGIDIFAPIGTPIYSATNGQVIRADNVSDSFAGKNVAIRTNTRLGTVTVRYMHLDRLDVGPGDAVGRGEQIGTVGRTGVQRSGPHLHLDIMLSDGVLAEYKKTFGTPKPDFPDKRGFGTQVPAESLIPASGYTKRTLAEAAKRNVTLRSA